MSLLQSIRNWAGVKSVDVTDEQPIDLFEKANLDLITAQDQLRKAQEEFNEESNTLELKIEACNKLVEKGSVEGEYNRGVLEKRLDSISNDFIEQVQTLTKAIQENEEKRDALENDIIAKSIELTALVSDEERARIEDTCKTWTETGLVKGQQVDTQLRAIVMAIDSVVKEEIEKAIEPVVEKKEEIQKSETFEGHYANVICRNGDKILFLKRASGKKIAPGQWCLPGGHIDAGESITQAGARELKEEANIDCDVNSLWVSSKAKCDNGKWNFYLNGCYPQSDSVALLDGESVNASWMTKEQWMDADLFFDLKDHLIAMELPEFNIDGVPTITKAEEADFFFERLEKAGRGEGSRGGHVIGHTKSGKPVYAKYDSMPHHDRQDNLDASDLHSAAAKKEKDKSKKDLHLSYAAAFRQMAGQDDLGNSIAKGEFEKATAFGHQVAAIGETRTWGGVKWKKISEKKWQPLKKDHRLAVADVTAHAENTSSGQLGKVAGQHPDPHLRDAAKREIERRKAEKEKSKPKPVKKAAPVKKEEEPVKDTEGLSEFTLGYAPFREGKITNIADGHKAFQDNSFRTWKRMASKFAEAIGLDITQDNNTIGIYGETSAAAEVSAMPMVKGTPEKVELFAALMGTLAPDKQHSVMTLTHDPKGTTLMHHIAFKDVEGANKFIKNRQIYGINDVSFIPKSNTVVLLESEGGNFNKLKLFQDHGERIKSVEQRKVSARFIGEDEYGGIVQSARDSAQGHNGKISGADYSDVLRFADKRAKEKEEVKEKKKKTSKPVQYEPNEFLTDPAHKKIEKDFGKFLNKEFDFARGKYHGMHGNVLGADEAKELSSEYQKNKALASVVHNPSSAFIAKLYSLMLKEPTPKGKVNNVVFSAGGTGAGKTSGIRENAPLKRLADKAHIVYDTNMSTLDSSVKKIDDALNASKAVRIIHVYRDPMDAFKNGAVPRAQKIGRTIPISSHIRTHLGSTDTVLKLKDHYQGNKKVQIRVIDNSRGRGNSQMVPVDFLRDKQFDPKELGNRLANHAEDLYKQGKMTKETYEGFISEGRY